MSDHNDTPLATAGSTPARRARPYTKAQYDIVKNSTCFKNAIPVFIKEFLRIREDGYPAIKSLQEDRASDNILMSAAQAALQGMRPPMTQEQSGALMEDLVVDVRKEAVAVRDAKDAANAHAENSTFVGNISPREDKPR